MLKFAGTDLGPHEASLQDLLSFWTGLTAIPPGGFSEGLVVNFFDLPASVLPKAHACLNIVKLPTVHKDQSTFSSFMDRGILGSIGHFGMA